MSKEKKRQSEEKSDWRFLILEYSVFELSAELFL